MKDGGQTNQEKSNFVHLISNGEGVASGSPGIWMVPTKMSKTNVMTILKSERGNSKNYDQKTPNKRIVEAMARSADVPPHFHL